MKYFKRGGFRRFLSGFLAAITIIGLMPTVSFAADGTMPDTITMSDCKFMGQYNSPNGLGSPLLHYFMYYVNGQDTIGLCLDHSKSMGSHSINKTWSLEKTIAPRSDLLTVFADYYYTCIYLSQELDEQYPDKTAAEKVEMNELYIPAGNRLWVNGWVQAMIWCVTTRPEEFDQILEDNAEGAAQRRKITAERAAAITGCGGTATVDGSTWIIDEIIDNWKAGKYTYYTYYKYAPTGNHGGYNDQSVLIPYVESTGVYEGWVKIQKVDENHSPLSGAEFTIYQDSACTREIGRMTTGSDGWAYYNIKQMATETMTVYAKETQAPSGYAKLGGKWAVKVNATSNKTQETAAAFNAGAGIPNGTNDVEAVIKKVDAKTGLGVGPCTIRLVGQADEDFGGGHVDTQFTTDAAGNLPIQWKNPSDSQYYVPPGQYTVTEVIPPNGYESTDESYHLVLEYKPAQNIYRSSGNIVFKNNPLRSVVVQKIDPSGNGLAGAVFEIYRDGQYLGSQTTGQDGSFVYAGKDGNGLEAGYYEFKEVTAPKGYLLPFDCVQGVLVDPADLDNDDPVTLTFVDYEYAEIVIQKLAEGTGNRLSGAVFEVQIDGQTLGTFETGKSGTITIDYGTYGEFLDPSKDSWTIAVREVDPPDGYLLDEGNDGWHTAELRKGQTLATFTFRDTKYPDIKIFKRDRETQELLADATFRVWIDGVEIGDFTTNANGVVVIDYDKYGRFLNEENWNNWGITVQEIGVPDLYNKDKQADSGDYTKTSVLKFGADTIEFEFEDTSYRDIKVIKKDADTDWPLAGAEFTLESVKLDEGGSVSRKMTTDASGFVIFEDVPNGTYKLWESTPPQGYEGNDEVKTIVVTSRDEPIITFEYKNEPYAGIRLLKLDAGTDQPIKDAWFRITPMAPLTGPAIERKTDENGLIIIEDALPGTYQVEELSVPDPYVKDDSIHFVEVKNQHDAFPITLYNHAKGMLYIQKLDAVTQEPLAGAYFDVHTAGGTFVATVGPTGPNGFATLAGLQPGSYVVKEIKSPAGHVIDPTPQSFEVSETDSGKIYTLIFDNKPTCNLWLRKYDEQTGVGLEGAVFKITKANGEVVRENATSGPDGYIKVNDLDEGTYVIQEIKAPYGYTLDSTPRNITLRHNTTEVIEIPNKMPGSIQVTKIDAKTKAPLAGARFDLYTINDKFLESKTSGEDGVVTFNNLEPGYYYIKESKAPDGYAITATPVKVEVKAFEMTTYEWPDNQNTTLSIAKRDKETKVYLAGATFEVRTMSGEVVATLTTDASGIATTDRLEPGWYKVVETSAPKGYLLNEEVFTVELKADAPATIEVFDQPSKGIIIHKIDGITKKPLAGAVIELRTMDGDVIDSYTSDASGVIVTEAVEPGYYYLVETKAPDGYTLRTEGWMVEVKEGYSATKTIENFPETVISVYKTDSVTKKALEGAEFTVTDKSGSIVGTILTDRTGWGYTLPLPAGEYEVVESKAPDGYVLDKTVHKVTLGEGKSETLRLTNAPATVLTITKIAAGSREPIYGAVFEVKKTCGVEPCVIVGEYVTDHNGIATTEPLEPGIYIVTEKSVPEGYLLDETEHEVCVKAGQFNNITIENAVAPNLIVRKIDSKSGKPIAGAVFKLETADHSLVGTMETDAQGEALFTKLKPGHYIVTETQAPDGYQISSPSSQTIKVEAGKDNYVDFYDAANGDLVIILQDKHTGEYLPGGQFIVTRESDQIVVYDGSTDVTGTIVIGHLLPGWYTVEQKFAPDNYTMVDITKKVEILIGQQQTVYFKDETAGILIEKVDATNPKLMLEGARFKIVRDTDNIVVGEYVTGKDGTVATYGLTPGMYTVSEVVAPDGYHLDAEPQKVHVKGGEVAHATFKDMPMTSITVNVVDKNTKAPIPGAVVEVWEQNGPLVGTYTTDTTGVIETLKIENGYYVIKLIKVPDGYTADLTETTVELKDNDEATFTFECVSNGILKVISYNSQDKAIPGMRFTVTEMDGTYIGEYTTGSDGTYAIPSLTAGWYVVTEQKAPDGFNIVTEQQNIEVKPNEPAQVIFRHTQTFGLQIRTTVQQTGELVPGVVYTITKLDGSNIGTYTSGSDGLVFKELEPGWYVITPVSAPNGYVIDTAPRNIQVLADGITVTDFVVTQMSSIRVHVVDGTTNRGLYGVRLLLKYGGSSIQEYTTDNNGYVTLTQDVVAGGYTLEMISVPSGYIADSVPKSIDVLNGQTTEITWALYKDAGQIQVVLTSADYNKTRDLPAGSLLQGGVFEIMNADTYQVVGTMISDSSGVAASSGLPIGRYIVKQITAPAYYAVSDQQVEVRIKINNDVVREQFQDKSVSLGTTITQKTNQNVRAGSTMRVDVTAVNNTSDVRVDNFFWHIKVPTDCARIGTLSLGTWNHAVWYTVSYKTNMQDYRVLASNLQSTNSYQYDLSTQSLGLQIGEYVTDVRMEFGAVPAGFAVKTKSAFTLYVLSTVYNGHKLFSRLEAGGQYNTVSVSTTHVNDANLGVYGSGYTSTGVSTGYYDGTTGSTGAAAGTSGANSAGAAISGSSGQWSTNTSIWTTVIQNASKLPSSLPKTGY